MFNNLTSVVICDYDNTLLQLIIHCLKSEYIFIYFVYDDGKCLLSFNDNCKERVSVDNFI